ncbi:uncharacterized protein TrAtP1_005465 [Trichoderma atroviride]|uniref:uncharacterized protein n=1 Tax=Hypocrea atroviridis TaxID=63577 RepID=UPI003328E696|nr:hypothetical protein TrAtP1_005465 [Trichoderma atroviride]
MMSEDEKQHYPQLSEERLSDLRESSVRCRELLHQLSIHDGARVREQMASFNIWAANMGVFRQGRQSIASRLSSAPEISKLIQQLLETLKRDVEKELSRKECEEESSSDSQSNDSSDRSSISSYRPIKPPEPSEPSEDDDAAPPSHSRTWTSIENTITSLRQLAITVQRAGNQHRQERTERFKTNNAELYQLFERCARQKVEHLFPNASIILQERMARSVATRRIRFLYLNRHQKKISTLGKTAPVLQREPEPIEADPAQAASPAGYQETRDIASPSLRTRTGINPSIILSNTIATKLDIKNLHPAQNKRAESVTSVVIPTGTFPSIPKMDSTGTSFTCPFCFLICPAEEAKGKKQWWNHLVHDFEPFFCVADSCSSPLNCASTYKSLLIHMREVHSQPRWQCLQCQSLSPTSGLYLNPAELEEHITNVHSNDVAESLRPTIVKHSKLHDQPALQDCPFCGGFPEELEEKYTDRDCREARKALEKHVEQHFITVALILVPIEMEHQPDDENDDDNSEAQRDNRSELDLDGIGVIPEDKCSDDACDCKDDAKDSSLDNSAFEDDPSHSDDVDIQDEWKFWSDRKAYQHLADDIKLREYFKIETVQDAMEEIPAVNLQDGNGVSPFLAASANGHLSVMRQLIENGADIHQLDEDGNDALFKATSNGHIGAVEFLIEKGAHRQLSSYLSTSTTPPILAALKNGSFDLARLLLEQEEDLNVKIGSKKQTILHVAISEGQTDIAKLLIDRVDLALQDADRQTPLFVACSYGRTEIAELLIQHKVNLMTPDKKRRTPLHAACANCHLEVARLLVDNGADAMNVDAKGTTALSVAALAGALEIVQMFLEQGAAANADHHAALLGASAGGHVGIVELLIKWRDGEGITEPDSKNLALMHASSNGHAGVVSLLLENGAKLDSPDPFGGTPLYEACRNGHLEVARLLIEKGADINATATQRRQTPLMATCQTGHMYVDLAALLLDKGADINALNIDEMNAAFLAAENGQLEVLRLLLSRGVDIFHRTVKGLLPIHVASQRGHSKTVDLLIENGSDASVAKEDGNTPLILATVYHNTNVVIVLLKRGAYIDAKNVHGQTSLLIASREGDAKIAKLLVDSRANVSSADHEGRTPLFHASSNGHLEIVKLLLDSGADMTPNNEGQTPYDVASTHGHVEILELLGKPGS